MRHTLNNVCRIDRIANVLALGLYLAVVSAAVGAAVGAAEVRDLYPDTPRWSIFQRWWIGDAIGALIVAPVCLSMWQAIRSGEFASAVAQPPVTGEIIVVVILTTVIGHAVFGSAPGPNETVLDLPTAILPCLLWSSLRLPYFCVPWVTLLMASQVLYFTKIGRGPFILPGHTLDEQALAMQAFLAIASLTVLCITAVVAERRRATDDLRRTNKQLELERRRYRAVVEDQSELIVRWLPDGKRTFVNDAYCRYHQRTRHDLLQRSRWDDIGEHDQAAVRAEIARLTPRMPAFQLQYRARRNGDIAWQEWVERAIFDDTGKIVEIQSVGRDVTEQRNAQEQLQRQDQILQHQSRVMAMGEIVGGISHELSQPLTAIGNWITTLELSLAEKASPSDRPGVLHDALEGIRTANQTAVGIVRRFRSFLRPKDLQRSSESLAEVVAESLALLGFTIRRSGADVRVRVPADLPPLRVDRIQVVQVFVNLIKNSLQSMEDLPEDQRSIDVSAEVVDDSKAMVRVTDSGPGMSSDIIKQIGEPFVTSKADGMGLGLSICQRIVEGHEGRLWYESAVPRGATFCFTLPLDRGAPVSRDSVRSHG